MRTVVSLIDFGMFQIKRNLLSAKFNFFLLAKGKS